MKYAYQVMIIGGISLAGELLNYLLPLPVSASVYGMLLMKDSLLGILIISVLSTMVVMVLTGLIAQILVRRKRDKEDEFHG